MMDANTFEVIKLIADVALVPLIGMVYSLNGRLSRMEGKLDAIYRDTHRG